MKLEKNQIRGIAALAAILVVYNVLAFVIPFRKNGCFWAAWAFGLLAILIAVPALMLAFKNGKELKSRVFGVPVARVAVLYVVAQLVVTAIFWGLAFINCPAWIPVVVSVVLFALAVLGVVVTDSARDEVERQDKAVKESTASMHALYLSASAAADRCADPELRKTVAKLAEDLQYADPVSNEATREAENTLRNCLLEIEAAIDAEDTARAKELCVSMQRALTDRNRIAKLSK